MSTQSKIYAFVEKNTLEFLKVQSGKVGWMTKGAAKNAFNLHMQNHFPEIRKQLGLEKHWESIDRLWEKQDKYALVEIYFNAEGYPKATILEE